MWAMQAVAAATLLTAATVAASCGSSGSSGSVDEPVETLGTSPSDDTGADIRACTLLTLEEIEGLTGSPVTAGPTPNNGRDGCEWTTEIVDEGARGSHVLELQLQDPATPLDQAMSMEGVTTPVEELGDEALVESSTTNIPGVMAGYRDAQRVVTLLYRSQEVSSGDLDPRTRSDDLVELLRLVHTRTSTAS
jgi:hypothetical protein